MDHADSGDIKSLGIPTQTPTQMLKSVFSMFSSQEIKANLVSFQIIFETLKSELFRFKLNFLGSKIGRDQQVVPSFA